MTITRRGWFAALPAWGAAPEAPRGWWMTEPIRWVQTNLRQSDAGLDARRLAEQLAAMRANVLLQGMGGIAAYYPTEVPLHERSPQLPPGRDLFGDTVRECHARGIRVVGRFDLSKARRAAYEAHPEWFFRQANGEPVVYNGLYSTCINAGFYRDHAMKILAEALDRYEVDGLFFNMFGNQARDYSGRYVGHCHCAECQRRYGQPIPAEADEEYRRFLFQSSREVAAEIGRLIREKRPRAGYFNYIQEYTDGIMSESNTAVARPLPLWPYAASTNVNRARNSQPAKMAIDLNMQFVDYWWRFATVPRQEIALRGWQHLAHGGALTYECNGTLDQQDRQALEAIRPVFQFAAANERHYVGQSSAARVVLLGNPAAGPAANLESFRGLFRLLAEEHIPFAVTDNLDWIGQREVDLVVAADWAPAALRTFLEGGGRLLAASARPPDLPLARVTGTEKEVRGYLRVRDGRAYPSLTQTSLLMLNGPFTTVEGGETAPLTLVPPSMIGPPEFIHLDMRETTTPGVVRRPFGSGEAVWFPWDLGGLYYRHSLPAHAGLFRDTLNTLLPRRQVVTDAHQLVELTLQRQGRILQLHLVNLSGHAQTGYFPPVPMSGLVFEVEGRFRRARTLRTPAALPVRANGAGRTAFTVPRLADYECVVLEP